MARIVITTAGTLGDHVPFVQLGKGLRARGHSVCMAFNPAMVRLAHEANLESVPCGAPFGPSDLRKIASAFDYWNPVREKDLRSQWAAFNIDEASFHDLAAACRGADLLISSSHHEKGMMVHDRYGVPLVTVCLSPLEIHAEEMHPGTLNSQDQRIMRNWLAYLNDIRVRLGFPALTFAEWARLHLSKQLVLIACSSLFDHPSLKECPQGRLTGFWFGEAHDGSWTPNAELAAFVKARPRPLVLALGSLPVGDAARVVTVHAEAAARLNRRLLIQKGWADLGPESLLDPALSDRVHFSGFAPHSWLFSKASAVIHHGGIGTTSQAMRSGCPMVIEPYGHDQFFNAQRIIGLGVGVAMLPHRLTAESLARVLDGKVLQPATRRRALEIGAKIKQEDGVSVACDLIEQQLGASRTGVSGTTR